MTITRCHRGGGVGRLRRLELELEQRSKPERVQDRLSGAEGDLHGDRDGPAERRSRRRHLVLLVEDRHRVHSLALADDAGGSGAADAEAAGQVQSQVSALATGFDAVAADMTAVSTAAKNDMRTRPRTAAAKLVTDSATIHTAI